MHFFHLSDLHIGKQLYGYSLLEDQEWILTEIYELIREKRPDGVLIAGDAGIMILRNDWRSVQRF